MYIVSSSMSACQLYFPMKWLSVHQIKHPRLKNRTYSGLHCPVFSGVCLSMTSLLECMQTGKKRSLSARSTAYAHQDLKECIDCGTAIRPMKAPRRCRFCYQREYRRARKIQKLSHDMKVCAAKSSKNENRNSGIISQQPQVGGIMVRIALSPFDLYPNSMKLSYPPMLISDITFVFHSVL